MSSYRLFAQANLRDLWFSECGPVHPWFSSEPRQHGGCSQLSSLKALSCCPDGCFVVERKGASGWRRQWRLNIDHPVAFPLGKLEELMRTVDGSADLSRVVEERDIEMTVRVLYLLLPLFLSLSPIPSLFVFLNNTTCSSKVMRSLFRLKSAVYQYPYPPSFSFSLQESCLILFRRKANLTIWCLLSRINVDPQTWKERIGRQFWKAAAVITG